MELLSRNKNEKRIEPSVFMQVLQEGEKNAGGEVGHVTGEAF